LEISLAVTRNGKKKGNEEKQIEGIEYSYNLQLKKKNVGGAWVKDT